MEVKEFEVPVLCKEKECVRCNHKLKKALTEVKGVTEAEVKASKLALSFDPNVISFQQLEKKTKEIGCSIAEKFSHETLGLAGLDCPDCAMKVEKAIGRLPGVLWVSVNFASSTLGIEIETEKTSLDKVISLIKELGYQVVSKVPEEAPGFWDRNKRLAATAAAGILIAIGFLFSLFGLAASLAIPFYALAIVIGGYYVLRSGIASLSMRTLDMNFLVALAVVAAASIGQWFEGALVLFLFSLGNALESFAMERNRKEIRSLIEQSPKEALVRRSGHEAVIAADLINVGDIVIVKPGAKIPVDGLVIAGGSLVDQAPITGESMPVEKEPGDRAFAGTINGHGVLEVKVTKMAQDSTLAKVLTLIERAQGQKAPAQLFTENFGRFYTPAIVILAALVAVAPPLFFGVAVARTLYIAAVLLVVSCPCALVISVPVAIVSAIANAARRGILVKGGVYLETAGSLSAIAFDKTGTLTKGRPSVTDIIALNGNSSERVLTLAAAVESRSEHPLSKAIHRAWAETPRELPAVKDFLAYPGGGVRARIDEDLYYVGSHRFFQKENPAVEFESDQVLKMESEGKTVLFVGSKNELAGMIAVADELRPDSRLTIENLRRSGIKHISMLTGDNLATADLIAKELSLDTFYAELLPEGKVQIIGELQKRFGNVAMVGDGVNDAPALATATLGIAMGAAGTDVALETADMALMADDISRLPYAIKLSKRALRIIKQNIIFSLTVIVILVVATLAGRLSLSLGVIGHEGSALLVIANGMRLLREVRD